MASPTLTVIGLDAMTPLVLEPLRAAGAVPHLDRLLGQGASGVLRSTTHPLTPQAWTTMFTGVGAGRHGIWDFHERDESGYGLRPVNGSYRREPAVWQRLSAAGRRVGVINVPFTWPVDDVNGFALAGFDAYGRRDGYATPAGLLDELERALRPARAGSRVPRHARTAASTSTRCGGSPSSASQLTLWLAERFEPELLIVVFMAADHAHHLGWDEWERSGAESPLAQVYGILDEAVGALAGALGGDIMLVSDHGGGPARTASSTSTPGSPSSGLLEYAGAGRADARRAAAAHGGRARAGALAPPAARPCARASSSASAACASAATSCRTSRRRLRAHAGVRLRHVRQHRDQRAGPRAPRHRRAGRRVRGRARCDRERAARAARPRDAAARSWPPCTGARSSSAARRSSACPISSSSSSTTSGSARATSRAAPRRSGTASRSQARSAAYVGSHRHEGIVALTGPSAAPGGLFASIEDVAPTIQYLLGEPIPESMEGRLIDAAIDPALLESRPPAYAADDVEISGDLRVFDDDEAGNVQERLRGLGYIE